MVLAYGFNTIAEVVKLAVQTLQVHVYVATYTGGGLAGYGSS